MAKEDFKPRFKGYLKLYLHDDSYEQATKRMEIRGEWRTKRYRIIKKPRRFQVSFHIFDKDGDKRGHKSVCLSSKGDDEALAIVLKQYGDAFINEIAEDESSQHLGFEPDLISSYAVIRA